jgi:hypothetical protein
MNKSGLRFLQCTAQLASISLNCDQWLLPLALTEDSDSVQIHLCKFLCIYVCTAHIDNTTDCRQTILCGYHMLNKGGEIIQQISALPFSMIQIPDCW